MKSKVILCLATFLLSMQTFFSQDISIHKDCMNINAAILAEKLISQKGEEFVVPLLQKGSYFVFRVNCDSIGSARAIEKVYSKGKKNIKLIDEISTVIIENELHLSICYMNDWPMPESHLEKMKRDELPNKEGLYGTTLIFPGGLMSRYNLTKDEFLKKGVNLSRFEYLKLQISKYLE